MPSLASSQNARVTVNVARNLNNPKFETTPYVASIKRSVDVGTVVKQIFARDADVNVSEKPLRIVQPPGGLPERHLAEIPVALPSGHLVRL